MINPFVRYNELGLSPEKIQDIAKSLGEGCPGVGNDRKLEVCYNTRLQKLCIRCVLIQPISSALPPCDCPYKCGGYPKTMDILTAQFNFPDTPHYVSTRCESEGGCDDNPT